MEEKEPNVEYEEQEYELESATIENEENEVEAEASIEGKILLEKTLKNKWFYIIGAMTMIFIYVFIISFSFLVKTTDGINYLAGGKKKNRSYREIYKTVESVQKEVYEETSVRVNKYLIISALTIFMNNDYYIDKSTGAFNYVSPETSDGSTKSMTVIKNFATVLAKYQIMTTDSCSASSETYREIASNDDEGLETFTLTAAAKEKNYNCGSKIPSGSPSTIQGRLNDNESGSLFYWNMIDENFFNNYYPELFMNLSKNGDYKEVYYQAADNALQLIYLYAKTLEELDETDGDYGDSAIGTIYAECAGVKVAGQSSPIPLEEYVAGVMAAECTPGYAAAPLGGLAANQETIKEAEKAFSIAIRSYTLAQTNNCEKEILNSSNNQNYTPNTDPFITGVVNDTKGIVITKDNKIVLAMYDSFMGKNNCDGSFCSWDYVKVPSEAKHTVKVPQSWHRYIAGGHGYGMSQWGNVYMAYQEKYKYQQLVKYFYADGIEFKRLSSTNS